MTKKKRGHPDLDEVLGRPWCYYCERDFDDLKILINHQKAKHFKCERCGRRLNTAGGLNVHMSQVHKEALSAVDNALPNRAGLDIEIFGMEGIPEDIVQQHTQRVIAAYHQNLADGQDSGHQNSGTPTGGSGPAQSKKPKFESPSDLKKRLAEHKAKKAEQAAGGASGGGTPLGAGQPQSPGAFSYSGPPGATQYAPPVQPPNGAAAPPFNYSQAPPQAGSFAQNGYHPPTFSPPPNTYALPPQNGQSYTAPQYPHVTPPGISFPQGAPGGIARSFGTQSQSPPLPYPPNQHAPRIQTPPQIGGLPARPGSLPGVPGLPQRPTFEAPHVNSFQMQQMHQGQIPGSPNTAVPQSYGGAEASSLDDLISGASRQADEVAKVQAAQSVTPVAASPAPAVSVNSQPTIPSAAAPKEQQGEEKASKKDKEKSKASRLVYSDNDVSPEEKMATLPRYAFTAQVGA
ncbi:putative c2h2 finger domain-containing protein [Phaeomoniella chlamydospora]|uniref:Putative c2h2 finger domain-containing protein n=1 Tax=Phaeomoniella chlamydospora TaxID=158046 RepID=A0A0G2FP95_PHACM|nr:putative c2h2 finger domain-containing protein [Phaeomoniella chlamydospora]